MSSIFLLFDFRNPGCDIIYTPNTYDKTTTSYFILQKHSPYEELFNYYIRRFQEGDLKQRLWNTYFPSYDGDVCPGLVGKPLGFKNCISAFLFLGIGIIGAFLIFIGEIIKVKMSDKKSTGQIHQNHPTTNHSIQELEFEDVSI